MTTEEFVRKAQIKHGDKYDYKNTVYIKSASKVEIVCSKHGSFWQYIKDHLRGSGCKQCAIENTAISKTGVPAKTRGTTEEFIEKALASHGSKYDYSKVYYETNRSKLTIICKNHGEFIQTAADHLAGNGCQTCAKEIAKNKLKSTTEEFITKAVKVHGDRYGYKYVTYENAKIKIDIECPHHGIFKQSPNDHLNGCGCRHCRTENIGWTDSKWEAQARASKGFVGYRLYVVKVWDSEESFIKIGKTFVELAKRFSDISSYYNYKVLHMIEADAKTVSELERKYQRLNKENKYAPKVKFAGHTECYSKVIIEDKEYK